jgi:hypothetical protein
MVRRPRRRLGYRRGRRGLGGRRGLASYHGRRRRGLRAEPPGADRNANSERGDRQGWRPEQRAGALVAWPGRNVGLDALPDPLDARALAVIAKDLDRDVVG